MVCLKHNGSIDLLLTFLRKGHDTRTTFMIRHIPNEYTQKMLQQSVDATNYGTYDFLYLPIDYQTKSNRGYAFINFIDTKSVIPFAQQRSGRRWYVWKLHKDRCSLSYANIQGKEALVEEFRNSTVMDGDPSTRPMIFYVSGPHKGEQQPFPEPTETHHYQGRRKRRRRFT
ncbi:hypothetical protein K492DRAFT_138623 [Lichtheimia hyalospora FSU 10163]|nr:hypothetical protein K492DRAFT_138623 [Lichtheimia hyalospora FSU 10163]